MSEPLKPNGRKVDSLNGSVDWELARAKATLIDVLGETDPVKYQRAMRVALQHLERAHCAVQDISLICKLAAKRGRYNKRDSNQGEA